MAIELDNQLKFIKKVVERLENTEKFWILAGLLFLGAICLSPFIIAAMAV